MVLLSIAPDEELMPSSETVPISLKEFIDTHYEFKINPKYKGFLGKTKAYFDRFELEEREKQETGERYDLSGFEEPQVFYSDPHAAKQFEEHNRKRAEERLRLAIEQSFSTALMQLIEAKGKDHIEVYKRANIDRKLFSKIRSQHEYIPGKKTIIALALALELSLDETQDLLKKAGFTLSRSILFDVIIEYFITQGRYDIFEINGVLLTYKQPILG